MTSAASISRLAVIGGTGIYALPDVKIIEELSIETPYGKPSAAIVCAEWAGRTLYFLPRHGKGHKLPPHQINYRANIAALAELDISHIVALHAVGGINAAFADGSIVIPDQLIDYSYGRDHSFFDALSDAVGHCDFTYPFSPALVERLSKVAASLELNDVHTGGCYAVTQGPRLETAAEINRLERDGCDIVGMTAMPEAALAREKGIEYASLSMVVNPAAGCSDKEITLEDIQHVLQLASSRALRIVEGLLR